MGRVALRLYGARNMAVWGSGDPRWHVRDLGSDGKNVGSWHWEDKQRQVDGGVPQTPPAPFLRLLRPCPCANTPLWL